MLFRESRIPVQDNAPCNIDLFTIPPAVRKFLMYSATSLCHSPPALMDDLEKRAEGIWDQAPL